MKTCTRRVLVISIMLATGADTYGEEQPHPGRGIERATSRFEFDNDLYFNTDNGITGSWSYQRHSSVGPDWHLDGVPAFINRLGSHIPGLNAPGLKHRSSLSIGQVVQTPDKISEPALIKNDIPYAGALALQFTWYSFNDSDFSGAELVTGVVGPASLGKQGQTAAHKLLRRNRPRGWSNQLQNEPIVNFNIMRKHKIARAGSPAGWAFDATLNANACLGNMFTQASSSVEMRFGHNMPGGFTFVPDPIGFSLNYKASLAPPDPHRTSFYSSLVLRGTGVLHNIFLDGNTFRASHSVDKEPVFGEAILGLHVEKQSWSVHLNVSVASKEVNTSQATDVDGGRMIGSATLEWRH